MGKKIEKKIFLYVLEIILYVVKNLFVVVKFLLVFVLILKNCFILCESIE